MGADRGCRQSAVLSKNDFGTVTVCSCGTASLNLGPTTVRVPAARLQEVAELLSRAVDVLNSAEDLPVADEQRHCH